MRGCCNQKLGNIDNSIEDFNAVLEIDPSHVNAAYARGACENKRGNFAKAIEDYHMALEKDIERDKNGPSVLSSMNIGSYSSQYASNRKF